MGWRTVIVESPCKLSYKNDYMYVKAEKDSSVYIPEIDSLIIATTRCVLTAVLLCELIKNKVNVVFCDEKHNPCGNLLAVNGCHNSSKKIKWQIGWTPEAKEYVFTKIIKQKILNQANLLKKKGFLKEYEKLSIYASEIKEGDPDNREGFAAKVYFNALFGMDFKRDSLIPLNAALDYGYTVMLSCFNRSVTAAGYLTQLGLKHSNEYNSFNYSCDLIEPFRVIVDEFVYDNRPIDELSTDYKANLVGLLQQKVMYERELYLYDAIAVFVRKISDALSSGMVEDVKIYEF